MTAGSPQDKSKEELAAELEELKQRLVQLEEHLGAEAVID